MLSKLPPCFRFRFPEVLLLVREARPGQARPLKDRTPRRMHYTCFAGGAAVSPRAPWPLAGRIPELGAFLQLLAREGSGRETAPRPRGAYWPCDMFC